MTEVTDREIIGAIKKAVREGDTRQNGEPAVRDIAKRLPITRSGVLGRLQSLEADGRVERHETVDVAVGSHIKSISLVNWEVADE